MVGPAGCVAAVAYLWGREPPIMLAANRSQLAFLENSLPEFSYRLSVVHLVVTNRPFGHRSTKPNLAFAQRDSRSTKPVDLR